MQPMEAPATDAEPLPLVLDVDTGIDDMVALLIAATAPELNLRGVTCVAGNVEIHHVARNTGKILQMVGRQDVPVSIGAARPLVRQLRTAEETHGRTETGEWNACVDPEAVEACLAAGVIDRIFPLDATQDLLFQLADFDALPRGRLTTVVRDALRFYINFHLRADGIHGCYLHDPVTLI